MPLPTYAGADIAFDCPRCTMESVTTVVFVGVNIAPAMTSMGPRWPVRPPVKMKARGVGQSTSGAGRRRAVSNNAQARREVLEDAVRRTEARAENVGIRFFFTNGAMAELLPMLVMVRLSGESSS